MGDLPSRDAARYRLRLLGSFGFFTPDGARLPITSRKSIALLALVALARSGERSRTWLQSQLWGSREPDQARASLRRELSNLRLAINPVHGAPLLIADSRRVRLDLAQLHVDVRELNADVANARRGALTDPGALLEGLDVPGEEGFEDWLREQRQHVAGLIAQLQIQDWERISLADPADDRAPGASPPGRKPSVGVVAFTLRSDDSNDRAIADGMTDEIGDALSRFSTLFVALAGPRPERPLDHSALCRELGVRYLLEGSIRRDDDTIRIQVRLTDGVVREQIWAQRFDATLADLFRVQAEIAQTVAHQIDSSVEIAERTRAVTQRVTTPDAYHLYWRANALFRQWERGPMLEAIATAQQVLELEPHNAWASALAAFCHSIVFTFGWSDDPAATRAAALAHYEHCLRHGENDPFVLGYAAGALVGIGGDVEIADRLIDRALAIHPASGASLFWGGWVDLARSKPARAIERFEAALRMNPRSAVRPLAMTGIGIGQLALGDRDAARFALRDAVQYMPHSPVTLAGLILVYALDGDHAAAAPFVARLTALGGRSAVAAAIRDPAMLATLDAILARYANPHADKASLRIVSRMAGDSSR